MVRPITRGRPAIRKRTERAKGPESKRRRQRPRKIQQSRGNPHTTYDRSQMKRTDTGDSKTVYVPQKDGGLKKTRVRYIVEDNVVEGEEEQGYKGYGEYNG